MKFKLLLLTLFTSLMLTSCFKAVDSGRQTLDSNATGGDSTGGNSKLNGDGVTSGDGSVGDDDGEIIAKVEIRSLIEPKVDDDDDGVGGHKRKLTIPKNYNGKLYLSGINISTLSSKKVDVRFNFGLDSSPITIGGTITTAPGLTPQTDVEVIVLDLKGRDFNDVNLIYDLYDYNTYDFAGTGSDPGALNEPVQSNRDEKLFCRGLSLKDDPTFSGNLVNGCSESDDTCKYAYAKVVDKGLVRSGTPDVPITPSEINAQSGVLSYYGDDDSIKLDRCLPDNPFLSGGGYVFDTSIGFTGLESTNTIASETYIFRGPYSSLNINKWEVTGDALVGSTGVFGGIFDFNSNSIIDDVDLEYGYASKLFPLYSKFDLLKDTEYMGSNIPDNEKLLSVMTSNGESLWMDGCNTRSSSFEDITGEHIGSCNVTATIEIISTDDETGDITVVDITDEVKLQLVKPAVLNTVGENVLFSSFQQCSSSSQCGSDSCCVNNRCWSKALVSQCIEDLPSYGQKVTGDSCTSDMECSSLCCNKIDGRCAPHDTISTTPTYCSKPTGQSCVAKEWCQQTPVTTCGIVLTGTDALGNRTCALRCVTVEIFGECTADDGTGVGTCKPPCQQAPAELDPNDPNVCEDFGRPFSELVEAANNPVCE